MSALVKLAKENCESCDIGQTAAECLRAEQKIPRSVS